MNLKNNQLYLLINLKTAAGIRSYVYELDWNNFYKDYIHNGSFIGDSTSKFNYRLNSIMTRYVLHKQIKHKRLLYVVNDLYNYYDNDNNKESSTIYIYDKLNSSSWPFSAILFVPYLSFNKISYTLPVENTFVNISYGDLTQILKRCIYYKSYANNRDIWYSDVNINNTNNEIVVNNWTSNNNDLYEQLTFNF